jgi:3',5'-cyclic-AMP phosphodiesterase
VRIIQFSDPHLIPSVGEKFLGVDTFVTLRSSVEKAMSLTPLPDAFFVTGDIAESGDAETYARFRDLFAENVIPVFTVPGNHDDFEVMKEVFHGSKIETVDHFVLGDSLCIFLDSHIPNQGYGALGPEILQRVDFLLHTYSRKAVIISLHHPPFSPCPAPGCKLQGEEELMDILQKISQPVVILSGHLHRGVDESLGHVRLLTGPSTFAQCQHPTEGQNVNFNDFYASHQMDISRQGFRVLDFLNDGNIRTEIVWN